MLHAVTVRLIRFGFQVAAMALLASGLAFLAIWRVPGNVGELTPELEAVRHIPRNISLAQTVLGFLLLYLLHSRRPLFANEGDSMAGAHDGDAGEQPVWPVVLAMCLVAVPLVLLVELKPLATLWAETSRFLESHNVFAEIDWTDQWAGLTLIPLVAILLVPITATATALTFCLTSVLLLTLWAWRSRFFPRAFAMSTVVQLAWLLATLSACMLNLPGMVRTEIRKQDAREIPREDLATLNAWFDLHDAVAVLSATRLGVAFAVYAIWLPALVVGTRTRTFFTRNPMWAAADRHPGQRFGADWDTTVLSTNITFEGRDYSSPSEMPADVRGRYEELLRRVDAHGEPSDRIDLVLEQRGGTTSLVRFVHNGREYRNVEEMPADVRQKYEEASRRARDAPGSRQSPIANR